jgi:alkanesulfonate monooxygenase SsuD/methylene tetrahydromethanopterin reductase-like flavin-dependent oxidoreductase (luciferase family)
MCGALAQATSRIEVRTGVSLWSRTPVQTAFGAATLDDLARGRFRLGVGPGPKDRSEGWHDVGYGRAVARLRDYAAAIRAAWSGRPGAPVDYAGDFYRFRAFALPRAPFSAALRLDLAANGPQMLRLAGEIADAVLLNNVLGGRFAREAALPAIRAGALRGGRPAPPVSGSVRVAIAGSREEALEIARPTLAYQLATPYNRDLLDFYGLHDERSRIEAAQRAGDQAALVRAISDPVVDLFCTCGTADECRAIVAGFGDVIDEVSLAAPTVRDPSGGRTDYGPLLAAFAT